MSDVRRIDQKRLFATSLQCGTGYRYARCINIWARVGTSALALKAAATVAKRCVRFGSTRKGLTSTGNKARLECSRSGPAHSGCQPNFHVFCIWNVSALVIWKGWGWYVFLHNKGTV